MNIADAVGVILAVCLLPISAFIGFRLGGQRLGLAMLIGVAAHMLIAFASIMEWILPLDRDNLNFHLGAVKFILGMDGIETIRPMSKNWHFLISLIYTPFGESVWLGYVVNLWVFLLVLIQLHKFCRYCGAVNTHIPLLVFALIPASLLNCNFLLRESFQILMLIIAVRNLEAHRRTGSLKGLLFATLAMIPFGLIHNGFFLFGPVAIAIAVMARTVLPPRSAQKTAPVVRYAIVIVGAAICIGVIGAVASFNQNMRVVAITSDDIDLSERFEKAAAGGARTVLPWTGGSGLAGILAFMPVLIFQFIFAPIMPFMISTTADLVAAVDAGLRGLFLLLTFRAYRRGDTEQRRMILYLMMTYLAFCVVSAVGTTTVGTAMRHHLKVFWIPIVLGCVALDRRLMMRRPRRRASPSMHRAPARFPRAR